MLHRNQVVYEIRQRCVDECYENSKKFIAENEDSPELMMKWKDNWIPFEKLPSYPMMMFMVTKTKYEDFVK